MKKISFVTYGVLFLFMVGTVSASSPYGDIDVYYNDQLLPDKEIAKSVLKIGEPFKVKLDFSVYQRCYVSVKLSELGENNFVIIDGPTSRMEEYFGKTMEENSTEIFEWTVKPTENWAGGSMPIDFVYQVDELGASGKTLVKGGFTVAYCTISNEYYEGKIPVSEQPDSETEPTTETAPSFTLPGALSVLALAFALFRR
ncbi:sarcinarray family MAST domain-containing protein [Methanosarcina sp. KYL-1]|uniref:sarcinarray family MAST domain-containing protein n=1 Tax=Methanosarcina sp. KYL-1 TaxID=2602068 RepID=UPI002101315D|nr:sarcinarray family MAST domain-containing protein [Methanosarcina sp. KYL-1]MCQ1536872.1 sarcinarray family MAST domain-containing protein [Methanosarcina sp. KYL-1]